MADRGHDAVVPGGRERLQRRLLEAGRVLMLYGAVVAVPVVGSPGGANATQAFLCLLVWLLGVCFLALVPAAGRFPRAAMAAAAMAETILKHLLTPWN